MDYHTLPRRQLQTLCKKHGIPANATNNEMADALSALLKPKPDVTPKERGKRINRRREPVVSATVSNVEDLEQSLDAQVQSTLDSCDNVNENSSRKPHRTTRSAECSNTHRRALNHGEGEQAQPAAIQHTEVEGAKSEGRKGKTVGIVLRSGRIKVRSPRASAKSPESQAKPMESEVSSAVIKVAEGETVLSHRQSCLVDTRNIQVRRNKRSVTFSDVVEVSHSESPVLELSSSHNDPAGEELLDSDQKNQSLVSTCEDKKTIRASRNDLIQDLSQFKTEKSKGRKSSRAEVIVHDEGSFLETHETEALNVASSRRGRRRSVAPVELNQPQPVLETQGKKMMKTKNAGHVLEFERNSQKPEKQHSEATMTENVSVTTKAKVHNEGSFIAPQETEALYAESSHRGRRRSVAPVSLRQPQPTVETLGKQMRKNKNAGHGFELERDSQKPLKKHSEATMSENLSVTTKVSDKPEGLPTSGIIGESRQNNSTVAVGRISKKNSDDLEKGSDKVPRTLRRRDTCKETVRETASGAASDERLLSCCESKSQKEAFEGEEVQINATMATVDGNVGSGEILSHSEARSQKIEATSMGSLNDVTKSMLTFCKQASQYETLELEELNYSEKMGSSDDVKITEILSSSDDGPHMAETQDASFKQVDLYDLDRSMISSCEPESQDEAFEEVDIKGTEAAIDGAKEPVEISSYSVDGKQEAETRHLDITSQEDLQDGADKRMDDSSLDLVETSSLVKEVDPLKLLFSDEINSRISFDSSSPTTGNNLEQISAEGTIACSHNIGLVPDMDAIDVGASNVTATHSQSDALETSVSTLSACTDSDTVAVSACTDSDTVAVSVALSAAEHRDITEDASLDSISDSAWQVVCTREDHIRLGNEADSVNLLSSDDINNRINFEDSSPSTGNNLEQISTEGTTISSHKCGFKRNLDAIDVGASNVTATHSASDVLETSGLTSSAGTDSAALAISAAERTDITADSSIDSIPDPAWQLVCTLEDSVANNNSPISDAKECILPVSTRMRNGAIKEGKQYTNKTTSDSSLVLTRMSLLDEAIEEGHRHTNDSLGRTSHGSTRTSSPIFSNMTRDERNLDGNEPINDIEEVAMETVISSRLNTQISSPSSINMSSCEAIEPDKQYISDIYLENSFGEEVAVVTKRSLQAEMVKSPFGHQNAVDTCSKQELSPKIELLVSQDCKRGGLPSSGGVDDNPGVDVDVCKEVKTMEEQDLSCHSDLVKDHLHNDTSDAAPCGVAASEPKMAQAMDFNSLRDVNNKDEEDGNWHGDPMKDELNCTSEGVQCDVVTIVADSTTLGDNGTTNGPVGLLLPSCVDVPGNALAREDIASKIKHRRARAIYKSARKAKPWIQESRALIARECSASSTEGSHIILNLKEDVEAQGYSTADMSQDGVDSLLSDESEEWSAEEMETPSFADVCKIVTDIVPFDGKGDGYYTEEDAYTGNEEDTYSDSGDDTAFDSEEGLFEEGETVSGEENYESEEVDTSEEELSESEEDGFVAHTASFDGHQASEMRYAMADVEPSEVSSTGHFLEGTAAHGIALPDTAETQSEVQQTAHVHSLPHGEATLEQMANCVAAVTNASTHSSLGVLLEATGALSNDHEIADTDVQLAPHLECKSNSVLAWLSPLFATPPSKVKEDDNFLVTEDQRLCEGISAENEVQKSTDSHHAEICALVPVLGMKQEVHKDLDCQQESLILEGTFKDINYVKPEAAQVEDVEAVTHKKDSMEGAYSESPKENLGAGNKDHPRTLPRALQGEVATEESLNAADGLSRLENCRSVSHHQQDEAILMKDMYVSIVSSLSAASQSGTADTHSFSPKVFELSTDNICPLVGSTERNMGQSHVEPELMLSEISVESDMGLEREESDEGFVQMSVLTECITPSRSRNSGVLHSVFVHENLRDDAEAAPHSELPETLYVEVRDELTGSQTDEPDRNVANENVSRDDESEFTNEPKVAQISTVDISRKQSMRQIDLTLMSIRKLKQLCKENDTTVSVAKKPVNETPSRKPFHACMSAAKPNTSTQPRDFPSATKRSALKALSTNTPASAAQTPLTKSMQRPRNLTSTYTEGTEKNLVAPSPRAPMSARRDSTRTVR